MMRIESSVNSDFQANQELGKGISSGKKHISNKTLENNNEIKPKTDKKNNLVDDHKVIEAIEKANKQFKTFDRKLEFSIHEKTKQIMVKVINTDDDTVIREIPSEKILDMVAKIWEMSGIFVDEKR